MFRRFIDIALGNVARQGISVLVQIIVARRLGDAAFGLITFAFSIYLLMAGAADFGSRLYCWQAVAALAPEARAEAAHDLVWKRLLLALTVLVLINIGISFFEKDAELSWVLRAYSIAVAFNQVAFDWWFLAQDRTRSLLVFNIAGAVLMLIGTLLLVHGPGDVALFALILSFAYGIPGVAMTMLGRPMPRLYAIWEALKLPLRTRRFVGYDWLQRIYQAFIPIVAWHFYSKAALGQFRIAYLFYWFAGTLAIYVGSTVFNRLVRSQGGEDKRLVIGKTAALLLLMTVPLSGVAAVLAPPFVRAVLGSAYDPSMVHLRLLLPWLVVPVIANFLREASMASGRPHQAMWSYVGTVGLTSGCIALFYSSGPVVLSLATLIGEGIGGLPLLIVVVGPTWRSGLRWRLPIALVSYPLLVGLGRHAWISPDLLPPYYALALNSVILLAVATVIIGGTLLAERRLMR